MDAAVGSYGRRGVGLVVRDEVGDIMVTACYSFTTGWNVLMTEAFAVLHGLRICRDAGLLHLEMETDSLMVANALQGKGSNLNYASTFIHDALHIACSFSFISFNHVSRKSNNVAHTLAKFSLDLGEDRVWLEEGPNCISTLIEGEKPCNRFP